MKFFNLMKSRYYIVIPLVIYLLLTAHHLTVPGLQMDELYHINASLGGVVEPQIGIYKEIKGIVIQLFPYLGALKAWIVGLSISIFGCNVYCIRLTEIFFGLLALYCIHLSFKNILDKKLVFLICLFLSIDSTFVFSTRIDSGPVTLMLILKSLVIFYFFKWIESKKLIYFLAIILFNFLGLYDKINFLFFSFSFLIASLVIYNKVIFSIVTTNLKKYFYCFLVILPVIVLVVIYYLYPVYKSDRNAPLILKSYIDYLSLILKTINGENVYSFLFNDNNVTSSYIFYVFFIVTIPGIYISINNLRQNIWVPFSKFFLFNVVQFLTLLLVLKSANSLHSFIHIVMFYPLHYILIVQSFFLICRQRKFLRVCSECCLIASLSINMTHYQRSLINKNENVLFSSAIYELGNRLNQLKFDSIICAEWGVTNPLLVLLNDKSKLHDFWSDFVYKDNYERLAFIRDKYVHNKNTIVISYSDDYGNVPDEQLIKYINFLSKEYDIEYIYDKNKTKIYTLYHLK